MRITLYYDLTKEQLLAAMNAGCKTMREVIKYYENKGAL